MMLLKGQMSAYPVYTDMLDDRRSFAPEDMYRRVNQVGILSFQSVFSEGRLPVWVDENI